MNYLLLKLSLIFADATSSGSAEGNNGGSSNGTSESTMESLKKIFQSPVLYIVLGCLVALILVVYLIRRVVRATPNATTIIVRKGQIHKIVDEANPKYFLVPFTDSVGAVITAGEKEFSSDKLFINNGPDALYKIHYTLRYKVVDPKAFYPFLNRIDSLITERLNDDLRLYADQGNALVLIKNYREQASVILSVINKALAEYQIEATSFKINIIEPLGSK